MALKKFVPPTGALLQITTEAFLELKIDPEGQKKYLGFLEAAKNKLEAIEYSLGQLAGKDIIDESGFASYLSSVRRDLEGCFAGSWAGFNREGSGCFGKAVNLDCTLRAMSASLGDKMIWHLPDKVT